MTNKEIAKLLYEISQLLELTDVNPVRNKSSRHISTTGKSVSNGVNQFEVIAYQTASRAAEYYPKDIASLYKEKGIEGLRAIEGVGETISKNIAEYIETGKSSKKAKLLKKIPKIKLKINEIPGVGPKTTNKIYRELKPKNIADLAGKLKNSRYQNRLSKISLREKSVKNILQGIKVQKKVSRKIPLGDALPTAEQFLAYIRKIKGVVKADAVGSLRRMKDMVGDIDIIAATNLKSHPSRLQLTEAEISPVSNLTSIWRGGNLKIIAQFVKYRGVKSIIAQGATKASVYSKSGYRVDLEILPLNSYGSLLQHFTGSKEHNIALRTYAQKNGMSVSEHGIKKLKVKSQKSKVVRCKNEKSVYKTLGMEYIPPELRENQGEVEAALKGKLPKLVELNDIQGDLQLHTRASDGKSDIEDYVKKAFELDYRYIGITDHSVGLGVTGGLGVPGLKSQNLKIKKINDQLKKQSRRLVILQGIEVEIKTDGSLSLPDDALSSLDYVIAAMHSGQRKSRAENTKRYLKAISNPKVKIIAHPTGRKLGQRDEMDIDWDKIFAAAVLYNTAMEINGSPDRLDLYDRLIRKAKNCGVKFVISTDAHLAESLGQMRFGVAQARRGWLQKEDILNTMELSGFLDVFKSR